MILFRCNAGPQIGFGHLTRCRALAYALREQGESCIMVGPDNAYANDEDDRLFDAWIPQVWDSAEGDASSLVMLTGSYSAKKVVLDDYRVNEEYQLVLRNEGLKWLQFEARTTQPIWADIVLNASPAAKEEDYAAVLRNPETQLLLGPQYAVLRPEFTGIKCRGHSSQVKKVIVTFGGGDDRGAILFVLTSLVNAISKELDLIVVSGANNPRNQEIKNWIRLYGQGRVMLKINPPSVATIFAECDLAIMAGGTTTYEAACCGLPMLLMTIADNQHAQAKAWSDIGVAKLVGDYNDIEESDLVDAVVELISDNCTCKEMGVNGGMSVSGKGAFHVVRSFIE